MAALQPLLRLVRDEPESISPPTIAIADRPIDPLVLIDQLQQEVEDLNAELTVLRRRGETLNFHMSRLDEELRLAARLQQDFLPKTLPQIGRVHFHTLFRPAGYVSGDFYDVMRLDEKNIGFYIADAVGHGVPAALLTMFIKHALATKQISNGNYRILTASETMGRLNQTLIEQNLSAATFATAVYGTINIETLQMTFSRGGHPHPILLRANGDVEQKESDGGLLGVFPDEQFDERTIDLEPGDRLLLYTDGIEVIFSDDVELNKQRWREELYLRRHLPADTILNQFADVIDAECGEAPPRDDLTMVIVEIQ